MDIDTFERAEAMPWALPVAAVKSPSAEWIVILRAYQDSMCFLILLLVCVSPAALAEEVEPALSAASAQRLEFAGSAGKPGTGKRVVLISGDEEYRSEESLPMLAKVLSQHHGFDCTVLFSIDPDEGFIDPTNQKNLPGMESLDDADLMIVATRFRTPSEAQMKSFDAFLAEGKPVIGLRTATHGFRGKWRFFGPDILGEGWSGHHGKHKQQGCRGVIEADNAAHPILNGVQDVFVPSDVYGVKRLTDTATILLRGAVSESLQSDSASVQGEKNRPMMPLAWLKPYTAPEGGKPGQAFCTTMGASVDLLNEGARRLVINAAFHLTGLDVPSSAKVTFVDPYQPSFYGFFKDKNAWRERRLMPADFGLGNPTSPHDPPGSPDWQFQAVVNSPAPNSPAPNSNPNIVIIYADDLGYGDVQCYNPERGKIPTPNIDRLAAQGMKFTDGHSSSAVCSPSRYTLLTGRYHWRTSLQKGIVGRWGPPLITPDRMTIAGMLRQHGYDTACFGKWHLGWDWAIRPQDSALFSADKRKEVAATAAHQAAWSHTFSQPVAGGPIARGFNEYFGVDVPNWPPYCFIEQDRTIGIPTSFLPTKMFLNNMASVQGPALEGWQLEPTLPALADRTTEYISRKSKEGNPFFVYMPLTSPHTPLAVNDQWKGKSGLNTYADLVMETDAIVGRVLDSIRDNEIVDNTLVIFTSDNGCAPYIGIDDLQKMGHYPSGPLRGAKADVWEGGHRVPFIVRWPGLVRPGSECAQLVHQADLLATCAAIVHAELPNTAAEDSFSLLPLLHGSDQPVREHAVSQSSKGMLSVRQGNWKMIFGQGSGGWAKGGDDQPAQLYNLAEDLAESNNLYVKSPDKVAELTKLMERLVDDGRSTAGEAQENDQPFDWKRFLNAASK